MMGRKIWCVEDDDSIRDMLLYAAQSADLEAEGFSDGSEFMLAVRGAGASGGDALPDLILLDIMLPGMDGIEILKSLKAGDAGEAASKIPVIMLTAKGAEYDRIKGLDLGADDYIAKPFSIMETLSRIRAVLRRSGGKQRPSDAGDMTIGSVSLDPDRRRVTAEGAPVQLTFKEFELLRYLMQNEGIVLSRDKILIELWGYDYDGENRTVDMHVKSLRKKLGSSGDIIKTVRNVGYKAESEQG